VASTLSVLFNHHPDATVHVEGSNKQRAEVYRKLISRHWRQIELLYDVKGFTNGQITAFKDNLSFEYLLEESCSFNKANCN